LKWSQEIRDHEWIDIKLIKYQNLKYNGHNLKRKFMALWFLKRKQKHNLEKLKNLINKKIGNELKLNHFIVETRRDAN